MSDLSNTPFQDDDFKLKQPVDLREILNKYIYHWPIFLLALLLAFSLAFMYLRYTPKIYDVKATLLIKDEGKDNMNPLKQFTGPTDSRVIQNEMQVFRSKNLMKQVVGDLDLNIVYKIKGLAGATDIYANKPFSVIFNNQARLSNQTWKVDIIDNDNYSIQIEDTKIKLNGSFDTPINTPFGICVIKKTVNFHSYIGKPIYVSLTDEDAEVSRYLGNLTLNTLATNADVIEMTLNCKVPERGKDLLNDLISVYNRASIDEKTKATKSSIHFINDRLNFISKDLNAVEKNEENYKISHRIDDLSGQGKAFVENVKENDSKLSEVNLELSSLKQISDYVSAPKGTDYIPSLIGVTDPIILNQVNQLMQLLEQHERLLQTTGRLNPIVKAMDKHIQQVNRALINSVNDLRASLNRKKATLEASNSKFEGSIRTIPTQERELLAIERDKSIKEGLYKLLLQKQEEAALSSATTVSDSRVIESPYSTNVPIKPQPGTVYLLALVFGIFVPLAYVFSKDALNFKVISRKDITDRTAVPIIGDIMYEEDVPSIAINSNSRTVVAEQFRAIRTNLQYSYNDQKASKITLFTSSMPNEGKSFISINIASALAIANRKTVILEMDLRKPRVSQYMNQRSKIGLSNYLIGEVTKEEIVQQSEIHPNLYLIATGPLPPNPSEFLGHKLIDELFQWLRTEFDEIIVDTPPIGLVTDALVLARVADLTIYVVRHGVSLKSQIGAIEALYQDRKFPAMNIILNGVKSQGRFGYGYESQYGYGYGYGYSNTYYTESASKKNTFKLPLFIRNFLRRF
jgi:tyrosine-protein kinase Etk/Wzc